MATETIIGIIAASSVGVLAALAAWIKWSIRTAITSVVTGSLSEVSQAVNRVEAWTMAHDRKHAHEQAQLLDALARQGFEMPDGWTPSRRAS